MKISFFFWWGGLGGFGGGGFFFCIATAGYVCMYIGVHTPKCISTAKSSLMCCTLVLYIHTYMHIGRGRYLRYPYLREQSLDLCMYRRIHHI